MLLMCLATTHQRLTNGVLSHLWHLAHCVHRSGGVVVRQNSGYMQIQNLDNILLDASKPTVTRPQLQNKTMPFFLNAFEGISKKLTSFPAIVRSMIDPKKAKRNICYKPPESNREPSVLPIELMLQLIVRQKS